MILGTGTCKLKYKKIIKEKDKAIEKNVENCDELYVKKYCKKEKNVF